MELQKVRNNLPGETESYRETGYRYNLQGKMTHALNYQDGEIESAACYEYDPAGNLTVLYTGLKDWQRVLL